jgi:hypothetical protein
MQPIHNTRNGKRFSFVSICLNSEQIKRLQDYGERLTGTESAEYANQCFG